MTDEYTVFDWWKLFTLGENEDERRRIWNGIILRRFDQTLRKLCPNMDEEEFEHLAVKWGFVPGTESHMVNKVIHNLGIDNLPSPPEPFDRTIRSYMDFSARKKFKEHVDFSRRVFIGVNFRNMVFEQGADFSDTVFLGYTNFGKLTAGGPGTGTRDGLQFSNASFHGTAHFIDAKIRSWAGFEGVTFNHGAHFQRAKFELAVGGGGKKSRVSFKKSRFRTESDFKDAEFVLNANFSDTEFQGIVDFETAKFRNQADFSKAKFNDRTSFRNTGFGRVPRFAETDLNETTDFSGIDWKQTERPYTRSIHTWWRRDRRKVIKDAAREAIQTWDKLALVMSQREKFPERHEFYRLRMRAQRTLDGHGSLSLANLLFDVLADFGWGFGRALFWWTVHIAAGAFSLAVTAVLQRSWIEFGHWPIFWKSWLVSFANSLAFLRLGSEDGYLSGPYKVLMKAASEADWVFSAVGTIQAVLGPILLFLVLLTLRNHFRLG